MSAMLTAPPVKLPPPLLTAEEFLERYLDEPFELVKGRPLEVPVGNPKHSKVCIKIGRYLDEHAEKFHLGHVMSNDMIVKVKSNPDSMRGADVAFVSYERLPKGPVPTGVLPVVPELIFEVLSPSNSWSETLTKVLEYLDAGVKTVVVVDPDESSATLYRTESKPETLPESGVLRFPDVLPGFELPLAKLFA